ncbi:MAG: hypothetical protein LBQ60_15045 [Bacteroidales bacterium]|jgi:hypothetical protein|nr:hypothetical protein [Bacteroidales bacterium]
MKKIVLSIATVAFVTLVVFVSSCQKEENVDKSLIAPNGEFISASISALKEELSYVIKKEKGDFNILNFEYLPVKDGYTVIINYQLSDGNIDSIVKTNIPSDNSLATNIVRLKSGSENSGGGSGSIYHKCEATGNCPCKLVATVDFNTGRIKYSCGDDNCSDCVMTITFD